jgi:hypothetical protein
MSGVAGTAGAFLVDGSFGSHRGDEFPIDLPLAAAVVVTDVFGAVLGAAGLGALTYGLITWQDEGLSAPAVIVALLSDGRA